LFIGGAFDGIKKNYFETTNAVGYSTSKMLIILTKKILLLTLFQGYQRFWINPEIIGRLPVLNISTTQRNPKSDFDTA
jgi:ATP-dependent protease Clp ATPase subunit